MQQHSTLDAQLRDILETSETSLAKECLTVLASEKLKEVTKSAPTGAVELLNIYSKRARLSIAKGQKIRGYEELVPALSAENESLLRGYVLAFEKQKFVFFTDADTTRLIGSLAIPF